MATPVHITNIKRGDFLRISLFSRKRLFFEKRKGTDGFFLLPSPVDRDKRKEFYEQGVIEGSVLENDPQAGFMRMGVSRQRARTILEARIPYSFINFARIGIVVERTVDVPNFLRGVVLPPRIFLTPIHF